MIDDVRMCIGATLAYMASVKELASPIRQK